jgi:hypothetical protein
VGNAESGKLRLPLPLRSQDARMTSGQHRPRMLSEGQHHACERPALTVLDTRGP